MWEAGGLVGGFVGLVGLGFGWWVVWVLEEDWRFFFDLVLLRILVGLDLFGIFWEIMWLSWNVVERVGNLRIAIMWDLVLELGFWYIVKDYLIIY